MQAAFSTPFPAPAARHQCLEREAVCTQSRQARRAGRALASARSEFVGGAAGPSAASSSSAERRQFYLDSPARAPSAQPRAEADDDSQNPSRPEERQQQGFRRFLAGAAILTGLNIASGLVPQDAPPEAQRFLQPNFAYALTEQQKIVYEAWTTIKKAYVDPTFNGQNWQKAVELALKNPVQSQDDAYAAIDKMVGTLGDPFTRHLRPEAYAGLQVSSAGNLSGVGMRLTENKEDGTLRVVDCVPGSPAEKAGIRSDDDLLFIDGQDVSRSTAQEVADLIRGPEGTSVTVILGRPKPGGGEERLTFELTRAKVELNPVSYELKTEGGVKVGYVKLREFNANAAERMADAVKALEAKGAQMYELDLTNNPGGLVPAGVAIAREYIDQGTIVYTTNRAGQLESFEADGTALTSKPVAILVNKNTASASEILAAAIRDNCRGVIVGEQTYGKGVIQSVFNLSDGSGMAVTVAKYETPNHEDINKRGIAPDMPLEKFVASPKFIEESLSECVAP